MHVADRSAHGRLGPRLVVVGTLVPGGSAASLDAAGRIAAARAAGRRVMTVASLAGGLAAAHLPTGRPRALIRAAAAFGREHGGADILLQPAGLGSAARLAGGAVRRLREALARLRLAYAIGRAAGRLTLVTPGRWPRRLFDFLIGLAACVGALSRGRPVRWQRQGSGSGDPVAAAVTLASAALAARPEGITLSCALASRLARLPDVPEAVARDMSDCARLVSALADPDRGAAATRAAEAALWPALAARLGPAEARALAPSPGGGPSAYALHLIAALVPPGAAPADPVDWYRREAARLVPGRWVPPLPSDPPGAGDGAEPVVSIGPEARIVALQALALLPPIEVSGALWQGWQNHFAQPLGGDGRALSRFEFCLALMRGARLRDPAGLTQCWRSDTIRRWFAAGCARRPGERAFSTLAEPEPPLPPPDDPVLLTGLTGTETGLGRNMEMSADALGRLGLSVDRRCIRRQLAAPGLAPRQKGGAWRTTRAWALHHVNADRIPQTLLAPPLIGRDRVDIGFLLWEFPALPRAHRLALEMLDEIWVPSRFVADAYAPVARCPVRVMGKGIRLPPTTQADLSAFGIGPDTTSFLVCFDAHSSVARKNPMAAVRAFRAAFGQRQDVVLIVKTTRADPDHWGDPEGQLPAIRAIAATDPRIRLIAENWSFPALLGLIKAVDVLVSPHRAEGFGLIPAYALAYARPVIATDHSGTRDFVTEATGFPVPARLVPPPPRATIHPLPGALWAEIEEDALIEAMRRAAGEPAAALHRALAGQALIRRHYAPEALAARYAARLQTLGLIAPATEGAGQVRGA